MTAKERIAAVLSNQPVDRTPVIALGAGGWITNHENLSYRELYDLPDSGASLIVKWTDIFGSDTVTAAIGVFTAYLNAFGCPLDIDKTGAPADVGTAFTDPKTEIPALAALSADEIRQRLLDNAFVGRMVNMCKHVKELTGDEKYLVGDIAGPFTAASVMVGTSQFVRMLKKEPDLVEALVNFATEATAQMLRLLYENGCDFAMISDPTASGTMISDGMFDKYVAPSIQSLLDKISYYPQNAVHICGMAMSRIAPLRDIGVKAFSMDYVNYLGEAIAIAGESMKIIGNLNPFGTLINGTPEEAYEESCEAIRKAGGKQFILAPGCDLCFQSTVENIQMMRKACEDMA